MRIKTRHKRKSSIIDHAYLINKQKENHDQASEHFMLCFYFFSLFIKNTFKFSILTTNEFIEWMCLRIAGRTFLYQGLFLMYSMKRNVVLKRTFFFSSLLEQEYKQPWIEMRTHGICTSNHRWGWCCWPCSRENVRKRSKLYFDRSTKLSWKSHSHRGCRYSRILD